MSNNKKGKSLRKILTTAYTAVLIGASGDGRGQYALHLKEPGKVQ